MTAVMFHRTREEIVAAAILTATATTTCLACWAPHRTPCIPGLLAAHAIRLATAAKYGDLSGADLETCLDGAEPVYNETLIEAAS